MSWPVNNLPSALSGDRLMPCDANTCPRLLFLQPQRESVCLSEPQVLFCPCCYLEVVLSGLASWCNLAYTRQYPDTASEVIMKASVDHDWLWFLFLMICPLAQCTAHVVLPKVTCVTPSLHHMHQVPPFCPLQGNGKVAVAGCRSVITAAVYVSVWGCLVPVAPGLFFGKVNCYAAYLQSNVPPLS